MSTKQPRCLTTMGNLPTPASKAYLVTFELKKLIEETHVFKDSSEMERLMFATLVRKIYGMERTMDRFSLTADGKAQGDFVDLNVKHSNGSLLS